MSVCPLVHQQSAAAAAAALFPTSFVWRKEKMGKKGNDREKRKIGGWMCAAAESRQAGNLIEVRGSSQRHWQTRERYDFQTNSRRNGERQLREKRSSSSIRIRLPLQILHIEVDRGREREK